jgi:hypothetical protein
VLRLIQREGWRLASVWSQSNLIHADYQPWNLLVRRGAAGWAMSAALDCDFGIFLRYSDSARELGVKL